MGGHVETQRRHAARVVPHALKGEPEGSAREIDDSAIAKSGAERD